MAAHGHDGKHKSRKEGRHSDRLVDEDAEDDGETTSTKHSGRHKSKKEGRRSAHLVEEDAEDDGAETSTKTGDSQRGGSTHGAIELSAVGADTSVEDLRHAGMNSWKKKKKEVRLGNSLKGGGGGGGG
eukprot:CAMPEP_0171925518 /NCGR_PEP_ID=MMETSP0993-20121228/24043_1 /TAXON_ID=483369 /ORGANISM="non described non described, Strain CCMP2098" /LENGTH=127 /DNA_ID=CAMNT_0012564119 /DNA_START=233 /DNA_END=612 /DNA_ORIENTATION=+